MRRGNLLTLRKLFNWHSQWYEKQQYQEFILRDTIYHIYLTSLFKILKIPTSIFKITSFSNNIMYIECDIYLRWTFKIMQYIKLFYFKYVLLWKMLSSLSNSNQINLRYKKSFISINSIVNQCLYIKSLKQYIYFFKYARLRKFRRKLRKYLSLGYRLKLYNWMYNNYDLLNNSSDGAITFRLNYNYYYLFDFFVLKLGSFSFFNSSLINYLSNLFFYQKILLIIKSNLYALYQAVNKQFQYLDIYLSNLKSNYIIKKFPKIYLNKKKHNRIRLNKKKLIGNFSSFPMFSLISRKKLRIENRISFTPNYKTNSYKIPIKKTPTSKSKTPHRVLKVKHFSNKTNKNVLRIKSLWKLLTTKSNSHVSNQFSISRKIARILKLLTTYLFRLGFKPNRPIFDSKQKIISSTRYTTSQFTPIIIRKKSNINKNNTNSIGNRKKLNVNSTVNGNLNRINSVRNRKRLVENAIKNGNANSMKWIRNLKKINRHSIGNRKQSHNTLKQTRKQFNRNSIRNRNRLIKKEKWKKLSARRKVLVKIGRLYNYLIDRYSIKKANRIYSRYSVLLNKIRVLTMVKAKRLYKKGIINSVFKNYSRLLQFSNSKRTIGISERYLRKLSIIRQWLLTPFSNYKVFFANSVLMLNYSISTNKVSNQFLKKKYIFFKNKISTKNHLRHLQIGFRSMLKIAISFISFALSSNKIGRRLQSHSLLKTRRFRFFRYPIAVKNLLFRYYHSKMFTFWLLDKVFNRWYGFVTRRYEEIYKLPYDLNYVYYSIKYKLVVFRTILKAIQKSYLVLKGVHEWSNLTFFFSVSDKLSLVSKIFKYYFFLEFFETLSENLEFTFTEYSDSNFIFLFVPNIYYFNKPYLRSAKMINDYVYFKLKRRFDLNKVYKSIRIWQIKERGMAFFNLSQKLKRKRQSRLEKKKTSSSNKKVNFLLKRFMKFRTPMVGLRILLTGPPYKARRKVKKYYHLWVANHAISGNMPLQTYNLMIDYYQTSVTLKRATLGLKVWVLLESYIEYK